MGKKKQVNPPFLVGEQLPLTLCITHFLDWSLQTSQRRAAEVRRPESLCTQQTHPDHGKLQTRGIKQPKLYLKDSSLGPQILHLVSPHR